MSERRLQYKFIDINLERVDLLHLAGIQLPVKPCDNIIYLKRDKKDDDLFGRNTPDEILTVKQLKEKYDLRRTKVVRIAPYFCCTLSSA